MSGTMDPDRGVWELSSGWGALMWSRQSSLRADFQVLDDGSGWRKSMTCRPEEIFLLLSDVLFGQTAAVCQLFVWEAFLMLAPALISCCISATGRRVAAYIQRNRQSC